MAFDINTAKFAEDEPTPGFDLSTASFDDGTPAMPEQPAQLVPEQAMDWVAQKQNALPEFGQGALDFLGELAAGANRTVTEFIDFVGPDTANAILSLAGSDHRVPTLTGALESTGIEGNFMEPGLARDAVRAAGSTATVGAGMVNVPRNLAKAPGMAAEFMGIGSASSPVQTAKTAQAIADIAAGNSDTATQLVKSGKVVADDVGKEGVKQGLGEDLVAMIKSSPASARQKMLNMLDIVEKGKKNLRYNDSNRALDVAGDSVLNRVKVVWQANRLAARRLDDVANGLRGNSVDTRPAVDSFLQELDSMGIAFDPKRGALSFDGSDIEGLKGPQKVIGNIVNRMRNTRNPDAYDVHRLKKFIDHQVSYGKSKKGLDGKVEGILKDLRHNLDGTLDDAFPEYNRVNTQYAETRGAIDALQDVAGKKMDLMGGNASSALGTLSRRMLSNAQSRVPLIDAVSQLDEVAQKYAKPGKELVTYSPGSAPRLSVPKGLDFNDDIQGQVIFANKLDELFGTSAKTSLQGDAAKVAERAAEDVVSGQTMVGLAREGVRAGIHKVRGINEDNALKAMRELLERDL